MIRALQAIFLSFYFSAGLWKLRDTSLMDLKAAALDHISINIADGNARLDFLRQFLVIDHPWIMAMGFAMVLLFQLSTFIPILTAKNFKYWGIGVVFFHFSTGVTIGIWHIGNVLGAFLVLILFELFIETDQKLKPQMKS